MRKLSSCVLILGIVTNSLAQVVVQHINKPIIDSSVFDKWPELGEVVISRNGNYILYDIHNQPVGNNTLVAQSTNNFWKKEFFGGTGGEITDDNQWAIFKKGDSICLLRLGEGNALVIPNVNHYEIFKKNMKYWLAYGSNVGDKIFVLRELSTGREEQFNGVINFFFDSDKKILVWQSERGNDSNRLYSLCYKDVESDSAKIIVRDTKAPMLNLTFNNLGNILLFTVIDRKSDDSIYTLHWYDIKQNKDDIIWENKIPPGIFGFDTDGYQLVFLAAEDIWYYKRGMNKMLKLVTNHPLNSDSNVSINTNRFPRFSKDGKRVLFYLSKEENGTLSPNAVKIEVWSYKDKELQAEPLMPLAFSRKTFASNVDVETKKVIRIEFEGEGAKNLDDAKAYVIVSRRISVSSDWYWQNSSETNVSLVSLENGSRKILPIDNRYNDPVISISPHQDYIIYYDPVGDNYFSYQISNGIVRNLTKNIAVSWRKEPYYRYFNSPNPFFELEPRPRGIACWVDEDSSILLYDSYDIWKVDPGGFRKPVNITHGYGRRYHICFEINGSEIYEKKVSSKDSLILTAFNQDNKYGGYYRKKLCMQGDPEKLIMGPYSGWMLFKAKDANTWAVMRSCPTDAPTIYVTTDFKTFTPLSNIQPQKDYNWYTSELINWKLPTGAPCQGILFKPENFDAAKKYPVLFNYYQSSSDGVYEYFKPEIAVSCSINIPYFVSRGYLVFMPDIHFKMGHPGESAFQAIVSAANYLARRPYVDAKKMALAGHSWGGYETNYIVTHTNMFAAVAEGAGMSDLISHYNSVSGVNGIGYSNQLSYEFGQSRMGGTIWQKPKQYRENSPVLNADKVKTPLLILHNKQDKAVPWSQGLELFMALRRLGSRVWMLQYDEEGHHLLDRRNGLDYTIRLTQFFDYYLKGAFPPKWMTTGISAPLKGIDDGLKLDTSGQKP